MTREKDRDALARIDDFLATFIVACIAIAVVFGLVWFVKLVLQ